MIIVSKKVSIISSIVLMAIGILISLLAYFAYDSFINFVCVMLGIFIILCNIYPLMVYSSLITQDKSYMPNFIIALVFIIIGTLFIFVHGLVMSIIAAIFLVILPIIRIVLANDKKSQALKETPLLVVGALVLFNVFDGIFRWVLIAGGIVIFLIGLVYLIMLLTNKFKIKNDDNVIDAEIKEV